MKLYQPKQMALAPQTAAYNIALQMASHNVVFVVGAGISKAPPTLLPLGLEIAAKLKTRLKHTDLAESVKGIPDDDLLALADAAEAQGPDSRRLIQKTILDSFDFKTATPNYAHLVISLLMTEANVYVLSLNWDTCIERAAVKAYSHVVACVEREQLLGAGSSPVLLKLHGCAEQENSIRVSSEQIEHPPWWTTDQINAAISSKHVMFLGVGSLPSYVSTTVTRILDGMKGNPSIAVVASDLSQDWKDLLANHTGGRQVPLQAEEFLDDILRALTSIQLSKASSLAKELTNTNDLDPQTATKQAIEFLNQYPAHFLWLWMRRGVFPIEPGAAVLDDNFVYCILAIALIHIVSPLQQMYAVGESIFVRCQDFLVELAWAKEAIASHILHQKKTAHLLANRRDNVLPKGYNILVIVAGSAGPLPGPRMPESVVDEPSVEDIIVGPQTLGDRWVSIDSLLRASSDDNIRELTGVEQ